MRHHGEGGGGGHDSGVGLEIGGHLEAPTGRGRPPAVRVEAQVVARDAAGEKAQVAALGLGDDPVLVKNRAILVGPGWCNLGVVDSGSHFTGWS